MKNLIAVLIATITLAAVALAAPNAHNKQGDAMLKTVVHINDDDPGRQENALGNLENILNEAPNTDIRVVCHGAGMSLLQKSKTKLADQIKALTEQGVRFLACENTMKKKAIEKNDLVESATTVPSGAVEVIRKQQEGFSYFRP